MGKKLALVIIVILSFELNAQSEHEDISPPLFSGLGQSELQEFFSDWEKEMKGKEIHRLYKAHGMGIVWHLGIEHSPEWDAKQGCWVVQQTDIYLPEGNYAGLYPTEKGAKRKLSGHTTNYLYFGKYHPDKRVQIRGGVTREEYNVLFNKLNKQDVIEFHYGEKVTGKYLSEQIWFIVKNNGKYYVEFRRPFKFGAIICNISSEKFTYSAIPVD